MENELLEKCRLTYAEIAGIIFKCQGTCEEAWHEVNTAQLVKALPLISAEARKQERERILGELESDLRLSSQNNFQNSSRRAYSRMLVKVLALKEGGKEAE